jgi:hypothetical protein
MKEEHRGDIVIYKARGGKAALEVTLQQETVWLNLNQITELFQRDKSVISRHIHNIFKEGELGKRSTVANFATVQKPIIKYAGEAVCFTPLPPG